MYVTDGIYVCNRSESLTTRSGEWYVVEVVVYYDSSNGCSGSYRST